MQIKRRDMLGWAAAGVAWTTTGSMGRAAETPPGETQPKGTLQMKPIGHVEKSADATVLRILPEFVPGLLGLDDYSHVVVLYWFDRNDTPAKRKILRVHPRGNKKNPLTGVFACRSPVRPNLIGMTICRILEVKGATVRIDKIDAFDKTPIVDLKPYIPALDSATKVKLPKWL